MSYPPGTMHGRITTKTACGLLVAALVVAMTVEISETSLRFTGISVVGANLDLSAVNPSGLSGVTLATRSDFNAEWQAVTAVSTTTTNGELEFTIPKPDGIQFMRLRANPASATAAAALSPA